MENYKSGWRLLTRDSVVNAQFDSARKLSKDDSADSETEETCESAADTGKADLLELISQINSSIERLNRGLVNQNEKIDTLLSLKKVKTRGR